MKRIMERIRLLLFDAAEIIGQAIQKSKKMDVRIIVLAVILVSFVFSLLFIFFVWGWKFGVIASLLWITFLKWFFYNAIREIPADPPYVGVLTILRKRTHIVLKEGFRFFPFYPWLTDFVPVEITKINQDLPEQLIRTPDRAEVGVDVSITWQPDYRNAEHLINFLNSGGRDNVGNILEDIIQDRLRSWALSKIEGPANWEEAMASSDEAIAILLKAILGDVLDSIPYFPTPVLLKYFNIPRIPPSEIEVEKWGKGWEKLEKEMKEKTPLESEEYKKMTETIEKRRKAIQAAKMGNGSFIKPFLGIILNRFTINQIKLKGDLAKYAELEATENQQRKGETLELNHVRDRLKELKTDGLSIEQAIQTVQVERQKASMSYQQNQINFTPETLSGMKEIAKSIFK